MTKHQAYRASRSKRPIQWYRAVLPALTATKLPTLGAALLPVFAAALLSAFAAAMLPVFAAVALSLPQWALAQSPHTHQHSFSGAQEWAKVFDDPERDAWQKPHQVIESLDLAPNAVVADIGSGTGYFTVRLAHFVPQGRVYGVDTEPDMVKYLAERAQREKANTITALTGAPDDPKLPEQVDAVLMVDVWHHIEHRPEYLKRLRGYLKPGARVAVIDFNAESKMGPPPAARIPPATVRAEFERAGYALVKQPDILKEQYVLVFTAK